MGCIHLPVTAGGCAKPKEMLATHAVCSLEGRRPTWFTEKPCPLFSESKIRVFSVLILALIPLPLVPLWVAFSALVFLLEVLPETVSQAPPRSAYGCTCPSCIDFLV